MKMTKHAQVDRISRLEYICDTVGIGEVVAEINEIDEYGNTLSKKLTDTGVIIIVSVNYNRLVTAFIASCNQAITIWRTDKGDGKRLPNSLYKQIKTNEKYYIKGQPV